ncbi:MAG: hypothetical protein WB821_12420 [Burkholderiaceae bacterium]
MNLKRLYQPRNPLFWMVLALNGLSTMLVWIMHHRSLSTFGILLVAGFALCNAVLGAWLTWRLVRDVPASK